MKLIFLESAWQELSKNTILFILDKYFKSYGNADAIWSLLGMGS